MDALAHLEKKRFPLEPLYVLHGDEDFLKQQVRKQLIDAIVGDSDPEFAVSTYAGEEANFASVRSELDTLPFLCERRLIIIEQADSFVSQSRLKLEQYLKKPSKKGILILEVRTFAANTVLAKNLPDAGNIVCKSPKEEKLVPWAIQWARLQHEKELTLDAAHQLLDCTGPVMGLIHQELEKLKIFVGTRERITPEDVQKIVSRSRGADVFKILEAISLGRTAQAFEHLEILYQDGQEPVGILGALSFNLRRCAQVNYYLQQNLPLGAAMDRAGIPQWPVARDSTRLVMRHMGRAKLAQIYDWLRETDLALKGHSPLDPKVTLEKFLVQLGAGRPAGKPN